MTTLNDYTFLDYIKDGEKIVICTAGYCGACKQAIAKSPIFSQSGLVELTDPRSIGTAIRLKVKKVPTVIYYRDGKETKRAEGTAALFDTQNDQA